MDLAEAKRELSNPKYYGYVRVNDADFITLDGEFPPDYLDALVFLVRHFKGDEEAIYNFVHSNPS